MSIEGNKELGNVKSLDDVICFTASGEYELYQVKFTIDPGREDLRLDFDWLLKKKPKGTSLVEKWSADLEMFGQLADRPAGHVEQRNLAVLLGHVGGSRPVAP